MAISMRPRSRDKWYFYTFWELYHCWWVIHLLLMYVSCVYLQQPHHLNFNIFIHASWQSAGWPWWLARAHCFPKLYRASKTPNHPWFPFLHTRYIFISECYDYVHYFGMIGMIGMNICSSMFHVWNIVAETQNHLLDTHTLSQYMYMYNCPIDLVRVVSNICNIW